MRRRRRHDFEQDMLPAIIDAQVDTRRAAASAIDGKQFYDDAGQCRRSGATITRLSCKKTGAMLRATWLSLRAGARCIMPRRRCLLEPSVDAREAAIGAAAGWRDDHFGRHDSLGIRHARALASHSILPPVSRRRYAAGDDAVIITIRDSAGALREAVLGLGDFTRTSRPSLTGTMLARHGSWR